MFFASISASRQSWQRSSSKCDAVFRFGHAVFLPATADRRDVITTVFKGVDNRMKSGYLLRDVIDKIVGIHFTSSGELHTLSSLYESMLR